MLLITVKMLLLQFLCKNIYYQEDYKDVVTIIAICELEIILDVE